MWIQHDNKHSDISPSCYRISSVYSSTYAFRSASGEQPKYHIRLSFTCKYVDFHTPHTAKRRPQVVFARYATWCIAALCKFGNQQRGDSDAALLVALRVAAHVFDALQHSTQRNTSRHRAVSQHVVYVATGHTFPGCAVVPCKCNRSPRSASSMIAHRSSKPFASS